MSDGIGFLPPSLLRLQLGPKPVTAFVNNVDSRLKGKKRRPLPLLSFRIKLLSQFSCSDEKLAWVYASHCMSACSVIPAVSDSLRLYGPLPSRPLCPVRFSRQEYWSRLLCPSPGDLPNPQIRLVPLTSPALAGKFLPPMPEVCILKLLITILFFSLYLIYTAAKKKKSQLRVSVYLYFLLLKQTCVKFKNLKDQCSY